MTNWSAIESVLVAWVKAASGYPDGKTIWADQTGDRPLENIVTLRISDIRPVAPFPEIFETFDETRPEGMEVEQRAKAHKEFICTLQAYGGQVTGNAAAFAVLGQCQTATALPSIQALFDEAGIAPVDLGIVQNISAMARSKFESRALCEFRFLCLEEVSDFVGYIETTEVTSYMGPPDEGTRDEIDI